MWWGFVEDKDIVRWREGQVLLLLMFKDKCKSVTVVPKRENTGDGQQTWWLAGTFTVTLKIFKCVQLQA